MFAVVCGLFLITLLITVVYEVNRDKEDGTESPPATWALTAALVMVLFALVAVIAMMVLRG